MPRLLLSVPGPLLGDSSSGPTRAPTVSGPTPNKNALVLNDRGHWEYLERETGFAGQPSWPSARDCVAANRRPSAWETVARSVSGRLSMYQVLGEKELLAGRGTPRNIPKQAAFRDRCGSRCGSALPRRGLFLTPRPEMGTRRSLMEQLPGWNLALLYTAMRIPDRDTNRAASSQLGPPRAPLGI